MADHDTEAENACALCGGDLVDHDISDEREQELRDNIPRLDEDDEDIHARVCTECGHISYYTV